MESGQANNSGRVGVRLAPGDVERVRAAADLVRIAGNLCPGGLKREGKEYKGRCPWHVDRNPSFSVYRKGNRWLCSCFPCDRHEDVFGLVMGALGVGFVEAVVWVAREAGVEVGGGKKAATSTEQRAPSGEAKVVVVAPVRSVEEARARIEADKAAAAMAGGVRRRREL